MKSRRRRRVPGWLAVTLPGAGSAAGALGGRLAAEHFGLAAAGAGLTVIVTGCLAIAWLRARKR